VWQKSKVKTSFNFASRELSSARERRVARHPTYGSAERRGLANDGISVARVAAEWGPRATTGAADDGGVCSGGREFRAWGTALDVCARRKIATKSLSASPANDGVVCLHQS